MRTDFLAQPTCPQAYWTNKARLHEGVPRRKPRKGGRGPCGVEINSTHSRRVFFFSTLKIHFTLKIPDMQK